MGHHVSKNKKRSSNNLTGLQDDIQPKKASSKTKVKVPGPSKGGASCKKEMLSTQGAATDPNSKMPLFRSQSAKAKKRYQHQIFEAENNPEPNIDVSNCELGEIPDEVYSICNYLQKAALFVNDNWLSKINKPERLHDFGTLRILDLHRNEIKSIPEDISRLQHLQVLNLAHNKLTKLPTSFGTLTHLQTLNIKSNRFHSFPEEICKLRSLRSLDISENRIVRLSKQLYHVRTLETLILDAGSMSYPPHDVCCKGTEAIMVYICSDNQMEYIPPSNFLLDVLDAPSLSPTKISQSYAQHLKDEESLQRSVDDYNNLMDRKRQELADIERRMQEEENEQAEIAVRMTKDRTRYLDEVNKDSDKTDRELEVITHRKEEERRKLLSELEKIEYGVNQLIEDMMKDNQRQRQVEIWIESLEEERMKKDDWYNVQWEEYQNLRKKEVLENMQNLLNELNAQEDLRQRNIGMKDTAMKAALESEETSANQQIENVLFNIALGQTIVSDMYINQEKAQKEAFEALQFQKDARNQRISEQILIVEEELYNLTLIELEKRRMKADLELSLLEEKRASLIQLLEQLMVEQEKRKIELRKRLEEMDQQKDDEQTDYWLVQFQRLLDSKPQAVIDRERQLASDVVHILERSEAEDYIPIFARHRMTPETFLNITDNELRQIGVYELGIRKTILMNIEKYKAKQLFDYPESEVDLGKKGSEFDLEKKEREAYLAEMGEHPPPSAPEDICPSAPPQPVFQRTTSRTTFIARGVNSECVVCMDNQSDVIFLKCGHVCTCQKCSQPLRQCPLCRGEIISRIKLLSNPR